MTKQRVAEVLYRDGANYKKRFLFLVPEDLDIEVGDDVDVSKFGITEVEWFDKILPESMLGFKYEEDIDHTLVEIEEIRDKKADDLCINEIKTA